MCEWLGGRKIGYNGKIIDWLSATSRSILAAAQKKWKKIATKLSIVSIDAIASMPTIASRVTQLRKNIMLHCFHDSFKISKFLFFSSCIYFFDLKGPQWSLTLIWRVTKNRRRGGQAKIVVRVAWLRAPVRLGTEATQPTVHARQKVLLRNKCISRYCFLLMPFLNNSHGNIKRWNTF